MSGTRLYNKSDENNCVIHITSQSLGKRIKLDAYLELPDGTKI